mmetsp:Transcript_15225/g.19749  ORF Transcript_15225/g.19749 Transcript_15225/m.19749 type:complete len:249 (-) Transcript_15225:161-907(-)
MSNRVVGGRYRVDKNSGQIQRDLMDPHKIPRFQEQKASQRLSKFRETEMVILQLFFSFFCLFLMIHILISYVYIKTKTKQIRAKRTPRKIPPLKVPPPQVEEEEKQRRKLDRQNLALAIKEAVMKKSSGQYEIPETNNNNLRNIKLNKTPLPAVYNFKKKPEGHVLLAGEKCNATQARLAETNAYSGVQKYGKIRTDLFNGQGDMSRCPNGQIKSMLAQTNGCDLNIPSRSADFRYEVDWRMGLRGKI